MDVGDQIADRFDIAQLQIPHRLVIMNIDMFLAAVVIAQNQFVAVGNKRLLPDIMILFFLRQRNPATVRRHDNFILAFQTPGQREHFRPHGHAGLFCEFAVQVVEVQRRTGHARLPVMQPAHAAEHVGYAA